MSGHFESSEDPGLVRERIARVAKIMVYVDLFGLVVMLGIERQAVLDNPVAPHYLGYLLALGGLWAGAQAPRLSLRQVRALELLALWVVAAVVGDHTVEVARIAEQAEFGLHAWGPEGWATHRSYVHVFVGCNMMIGIGVLALMRAAAVPSRPLWTLLVTLPMIIPLVLGVVLDGLERPEMLMTFAMWWTIISGASAGLSGTVHSLRRAVRRAEDRARRLGQYTLEAKIGSGGMGEVYRARHAMMRRPTAVKVVSADTRSVAYLHRFEREVQLSAQLSHPHTITIYDYGRTVGGDLYYAMELLEGATVQDVVERTGPMAPARVVHVLRALAGALSEAHGCGLIHRDVKPGNIMLCTLGHDFDVPKLLDFGLVKQITGDTELELSGSNEIVGTPLYLAPEAISTPDSVEQRSDLYSLAAVAYFMLTATPVFEAQNFTELCAKHLYTAPERPSARLGRELPAALEQLVLVCLSKSPDERPADGVELGERLAGLEGVEPWPRSAREAWWMEHGEAVGARGELSWPTLADTIQIATPNR